ncbi:MAG TPA: hypothetical protein VK610_03110 [Rhodothermales bacterium]|nr:hypothetical protein [Rhodothermales bacterium]
MLLLVSTTQYPGGSQHDANAPGFHWQHNYLSNLLNPVAVNGQPNAARPWAVAGVCLLALSGAVFHARFSKKIPHMGAANVVKWAGIAATAFAVLAATPLHDLAVTVAATLTLLSMFYVTVFVFKSKLHLHKVLCVSCMLVIYVCCFIYSTRMGLVYLPILQKASLLMQIAWMLGLTYFTEKEDFQPQAPIAST